MSTLNRTAFQIALALLIVTAAPCVHSAPRKAPTAASSVPEEAEFPAWEDVRTAWDEHLTSKHGYQTNDLVTREQFEQFLPKLKELGWELSDKSEQEITKKLLPEQHFIVKQLRTNNGIRFMRRINELPLGYDRIHRLSQLKDGSKRVRELIDNPQGYKLIEYMTQSSGGKNMGQLLGNVPQGKDFNKPTGSLYTQSQIEKFLSQQHQLAAHELTNGSAATPPKPIPRKR